MPDSRVRVPLLLLSESLACRDVRNNMRPRPICDGGDAIAGSRLGAARTHLPARNFHVCVDEREGRTSPESHTEGEREDRAVGWVGAPYDPKNVRQLKVRASILGFRTILQDEK
jgi:hypothetical protein